MKRLLVLLLSALTLCLLLTGCASSADIEEARRLAHYEGYEEGHHDGYDEGYEEGYENGLESGSDTGYEDGYRDGYAEAKYRVYDKIAFAYGAIDERDAYSKEELSQKVISLLEEALNDLERGP